MPCAKHTSSTAHLCGAQQTGSIKDLQAWFKYLVVMIECKWV